MVIDLLYKYLDSILIEYPKYKNRSQELKDEFIKIIKQRRGDANASI